MKITIRLHNFVNNWDINSQKDFNELYKDYNNSYIKQTNEFSIDINKTDTIDILKKKIFIYLSEKITENWSDGKVDKYTFTKSDFIDDDKDYLITEIKEYVNVYKYNKNIEDFPLPHPKYLSLFHNNEQIDVQNDFYLDSDPSFLKKPYNMFQDITNKINLEEFVNTGISNIFKLLKTRKKYTVIKKDNLDISSYDLLDVYYFYDFFSVINKYEVPDSLMNNYVKLFWPDVDYIEFKRTKKFINDNNKFVDIKKHLISNNEIIDNFEKIKTNNFLKFDASSNIIIQANYNNDIRFVDLLKLFHLIPLSNNYPIISLFIDGIGIKKKVKRSFKDNPLIQQINYVKKNNVQIKVKYGNNYYSLNISDKGHIEVVIDGFTIDENILTRILDNVNDIISKINTLNINLKSLRKKKIELIDTNFKKWDINTNSEFSSIKLTSTIISNEVINLETIASISKCLSPYIELINVSNKRLDLFYVKESLYSQDYKISKYIIDSLKNARKLNVDITNINFLDNLKTNISVDFHLSLEESNFILNKWFQNNKVEQDNIPRLKGVYIVLKEISSGKYNVIITGITKWINQEIIIKFIERLLDLYKNFNKYDYFKNSCKNVKIVKTKVIKQSNLKRLQNRLGDLLTNSSKSYGRLCQKKFQPYIFDTEDEYKEWYDNNKINVKSDELSIYNKFCNYDEKTKRNLINKYQLKNINLNSSCIQIQKEIFIKNKYTKEELLKIAENLNIRLKDTKANKIREDILEHFTIQQNLINSNYLNPQSIKIEKEGKNYYLGCPSDSKAKFIGFLDLNFNNNFDSADKKIKHKYCVPCCIKKMGSIKEDFCTNRINYDTYIDLKENRNTSLNYILNNSNMPLDIDRYGLLHDDLNILLNKFNITVNNKLKLKNKIFVRKGVDQSRSFINSILESITIHTQKVLTFNNVLKNIININDNVYRSLNDGQLYLDYPDKKEFFENINNLSFQEVWELMCLPGIITTDGFNIIIFEEIDSKIYTVCPKNQQLKYFFKKKLPTLLLFKYDDFFEPIVSIDKDSEEVYLDIKTDVYDNIYKFYKLNCNIKMGSTAKSIYYKKILKDNDFVQILNPFNKVLFFQFSDNTLFPTKPSGMISTLPYKTNLKVLPSYHNQVDLLEKYNLDINTFVDDKQYVQGLIVNKYVFIPIIPIKFIVSMKPPINTNLNLLNNIDNSILKGKHLFNYSFINKIFYKEELYQRFRFELSKYLQENNDLKNIKEKNNLLDKLNKIYNKIVKNLDDIPNLTTFKKSNIRNLCNVNDNIFCENSKIIIPKKFKNEFLVKIVYELLKYPQKRDEIFNFDIDQVIDPLVFSNDINYVFF